MRCAVVIWYAQTVLYTVVTAEIASQYGRHFYIVTPGMFARTEPVYLILQHIQDNTVPVNIQLVGDRRLLDQSINVPSKYFYKLQLKRQALPIKAQVEPVVFEVKSTGKIRFYFSVCVVVHKGPQDVATYQAWPTELFGTDYYVFTLRYQPFLYLVASEDYTNFHIGLKNNMLSTNLKLGLEFYSAEGDMIYFKGSLKSAHGLSIDYCDVSLFQNVSTLKGVYIKSDKKIGVVSGNCAPSVDLNHCSANKNTSTFTGDLAADMLIGVEDLGTEYIVFGIKSRSTESMITVIAVLADAEFCLWKNDFGDVDCYKISLDDSIDLDVPKGARRLRSTTTVQVMYVQRASCNVKDAGDVSITTLIPTQHFHTTYIWITDISSSHPLHHYLVILSPQAAIKYLKLNLIEIGDKGYSWDWVIGTIKWKMVEISLTSKVGSLSAGGFNLGCYLYGLGVNVSYMYAPGFEKGAMPCTETETAAGDEVDNDCDGEIDEESNNNFDDDMDGKIDEDLENVGEISGGWGQWMWWSCTNTCASHQARTRKCDHPKPAANQRGCLGKIEDRKPWNCSLCGGWGQWSEWRCTDICQATYMERNRTCDNPKPSDPKYTCEGDKVSQKPSNCNVCAADAGEWGDWTSWKCQSDICTYTYTQYRVRTCNKLTHAFESTKCYGSDFQDRRVCPPYRWGVECINNCYKCVDQCDSEGRCTNCILGHKFPNLSCNKECELFEFGANCEGNCLNKCAEDCLERYDGTCPFNKIHLLWIFLFIIPVGGLAYILYERKASEPLVIENIESVIAFTNEKETDITTHMSTTTTELSRESHTTFGPHFHQGESATTRKNISIGDMISGTYHSILTALISITASAYSIISETTGRDVYEVSGRQFYKVKDTRGLVQSTTDLVLNTKHKHNTEVVAYIKRYGRY